MTGRVLRAARRAATRAVALALGVGIAGCTSYTYNCNVKDACRTSAADAPGVHIVTGSAPTPDVPAAPSR